MGEASKQSKIWITNPVRKEKGLGHHHRGARGKDLRYSENTGLKYLRPFHPLTFYIYEKELSGIKLIGSGMNSV